MERKELCNSYKWPVISDGRCGFVSGRKLYYIRIIVVVVSEYNQFGREGGGLNELREERLTADQVLQARI